MAGFSVKRRCSTAQGGFTLLELMVAIAILGSGLAAIAGGISMSIRATSLAAGYEQARSVANNQLALYLSSRPDRESKTTGTDNGVSWSLQAETDPDQQGLLQVSIEARFFAPGGERTVTLITRETLRALPERLQTTQSAPNQGS